jgi:hypothetical protein
VGTLSLFTELIGSIRLALSLWDGHEKTKYFDKVIKLEEQQYEEINKPEYEGPSGDIPKDERKDYLDHATLDDLDRQLCILSREIGAKIRGADLVPKQA